MQYEGYVLTPKPFGESSLLLSTIVYPNWNVAVAVAGERQVKQHISKVSVDVDKLFIDDITDPFVDIGKFRSLLSPEQYLHLAKGNPVELTETNEWERIRERHPTLGLMDVFHQFPDEFDKLPMWAEDAYNSTTVYNMLLLSGYGGSIHGIHGAVEGNAIHAFHTPHNPINFIEEVTV